MTNIIITKEKMVDSLNATLKAKRNTDNYTDGVLDMYNTILKEATHEQVVSEGDK